MRRFVLTKPAERDLDQIKQFLVERAGPRIARRVLKEVRAVLARLGDEPEISHVRDDLTARPVKFWPVFSYLIVYDSQSKPVEIIRILHGMRDVEDNLN